MVVKLPFPSGLTTTTRLTETHSPFPSAQTSFVGLRIRKLLGLDPTLLKEEENLCHLRALRHKFARSSKRHSASNANHRPGKCRDSPDLIRSNVYDKKSTLVSDRNWQSWRAQIVPRYEVESRMVANLLEGKMDLQKSACGVSLQTDSESKTEAGSGEVSKDGEEE
ncbi:hypothetical protein F3Y22_tig00111503pilonHSYRG00004 [Hibiscus syriacus]|uniref:Uncharacterized protein n=1 Tax=Hibiscus syriacus TaxID=106335 RepID=A0A6A2XMR2_HIBSY|nr:hypothetical protein F3Y22_tig00111503pilonHSYRG00004 [Hibiscus syriacus]